MTGRHHRPRPPGTALVVCTGRGEHDRVRLRALTFRRMGDGLHVFWEQRQGPAPVTGFRDENGWQTFEFRCPAPGCRRNPKYSEPRLAEIAAALARHQQVTGNDPVIIDISAIDRA